MEWIIGLIAYAAAVTFILSFMMGASLREKEWHDDSR